MCRLREVGQLGGALVVACGSVGERTFQPASVPFSQGLVFTYFFMNTFTEHEQTRPVCLFVHALGPLVKLISNFLFMFVFVHRVGEHEHGGENHEKHVLFAMPLAPRSPLLAATTTSLRVAPAQPKPPHGCASAGALNAESFCERIFSCAGGVMDEGNSLLSENYLEKLTLLRMNRPFMEFMRKHYNHVSEQGFNMTVVRAEEQREAPSTPARRRAPTTTTSGRRQPPSTPPSPAWQRRLAPTTARSTLSLSLWCLARGGEHSGPFAETKNIEKYSQAFFENR